MSFLLQTGVASPLVTCSRSDTLQRALELLAAANGRADRLVCLDAEKRLTGIVSISDILNYFIAERPPWDSGASAGTQGGSSEPGPHVAGGEPLMI
jgi:CBS domain-containing protein